MSKIFELFGQPVDAPRVNWRTVVDGQRCPFTGDGCSKNRKSESDIKIGTCTVDYRGPVIICPHRLLEDRIFHDCVHLLAGHRPGHQLRVIKEVQTSGGNIDYVLASVAGDRIVDLVAIEFQTLDTSGTVWPERQRLLKRFGLPVKAADAASTRSFGMNWKMTAKTILVQLHHKIATFEQLGKHLVLVVQDRLLDYMRAEFSFGHLRQPAHRDDSMHFHAYALAGDARGLQLTPGDRLSTDAAGVALALANQGGETLTLAELTAALQRKLPSSTKL